MNDVQFMERSGLHRCLAKFGSGGGMRIARGQFTERECLLRVGSDASGQPQSLNTGVFDLSTVRELDAPSDNGEE